MNKVFFYRANIVDYIRLILLVAAFVCHDDPYLFFVLYALSQTMDMLDGYMARKYNECSSFGAVLDMVLDRASDAMIFVLLGMLYPLYNPLFGFLALLDLCSHWTHMYVSVLEHHHHKECTNPILKFYYKKSVLALLCAGNEGCWMSLYLLHHAPDMFQGAELVARCLFYFCLPLAIAKQFISIVQWCDACEQIAEYDLKNAPSQQTPAQDSNTDASCTKNANCTESVAKQRKSNSSSD